ncbi:MAG: TrkA family potassium uptake protein [Dehalococcoidales bacterium]|nr:TrkA family potassium uptake protein [Dehalococcoidales bacterium]
MYVIIMGGGQVGVNLAQKHLAARDEVLVIEQNKNELEWITRKLNKDYVLFGDGCEVSVQNEAGMIRADMFIAATKQDEDNLIACQIAKNHFNVKTTVARIHDPKHESIFNAMGIDIIIDDTNVVISELEHRIVKTPVESLLEIPSITSQIVKVIIPDNGRVVNQLVKDIKLPDETVIMGIFRKDLPLIKPDVQTYYMAGDMLVVCVREESREALLKILTK